ncbi:MAG: hypothetical protein K2Y37_03425 [Pirellulales bacterium]|nr:hypothetical protein [Pirellulales bacterium]
MRRAAFATLLVGLLPTLTGCGLLQEMCCHCGGCNLLKCRAFALSPCLRGKCCGGGCGECYFGELSDPPTCWDPCDCCGNWTGPGGYSMYRPGEAYPFTPIYPINGPAQSSQQPTPADGAPTPIDLPIPNESAPLEGGYESEPAPSDASMHLPPGAKIISRSDRALEPGETPPRQVQQAAGHRQVRGAQYHAPVRRNVRR